MPHPCPAPPLARPARPTRLAHATALFAALALAAAAPAFAAPNAAEQVPNALAFKQPAKSPETILAYVNGVPVTQGRLTAADEDLGPILVLQGPQREAYLLDYVIDSMLVARFAERNRFDKAANFDRRVEYERTKLLGSGVLREVAAKVTSEAAMRTAAEKAQRELITDLRKTATIQRFSPADKH